MTTCGFSAQAGMYVDGKATGHQGRSYSRQAIARKNTEQDALA